MWFVVGGHVNSSVFSNHVQALLEVVNDLFEEQTDLEKIVRKIMHRAQTLLKCERCSVQLLEDIESPVCCFSCLLRVCLCISTPCSTEMIKYLNIEPMYNLHLHSTRLFPTFSIFVPLVHFLNQKKKIILILLWFLHADSTVYKALCMLRNQQHICIMWGDVFFDDS